MTLLGILLASIGAGDILRITLPRRWPAAARLAIVLASDALLLCTAVAINAAPWWMLATAIMPVALWRRAIRSPSTPPGSPARSELLTARPGMLLIALLLIPAFGLGAEALSQGWLGYSATLPSTTAELPALAVGLGLFLTISSNALVRAALDRDAPPNSIASAQSPQILAPPQLKGGRWIGPLERLALTSLLATGAFPVAAGVIAAKGIVRFPEIQADSESGNKAEYFLVGSLVSWTLALIAFGVLWYSADLPPFTLATNPTPPQ